MTKTKVDYDGPNEKFIIFFSNFGFLSSPRAKHIDTVSDIQSPTVGLGDDFQREKIDLSAPMTLTRKQKQIL